MTARPLIRELRPSVEQPSSSAAKVLVLLTTMLDSGRKAVSLTEVALAARLPKSTTHRLLGTLEQHGFVDREGCLYRLGDSFLDLSETARWSSCADLRDAAYPRLAGLFERSGAIAVHLAVLRGRSIQYVDKLMRPEGVRLPTRVGGRFPAACTGLGKAMLAVGPPEVLEDVLLGPLPRATPHSVTAHGRLLTQLRHVRDDGFVVEREEACHGFVCIAAPILSEGEPIAAVSMAVPTVALGRSAGGRVAELGRLVSATAESVGAAMVPSMVRPGVPATGTVHSLLGRSRVDSGTTSPTSLEQPVVH
ncbi:IclR family transcriptional regulator [Saccharomonospora sp. NPDC006951]